MNATDKILPAIGLRPIDLCGNPARRSLAAAIADLAARRAKLAAHAHQSEYWGWDCPWRAGRADTAQTWAWVARQAPLATTRWRASVSCLWAAWMALWV